MDPGRCRCRDSSQAEKRSIANATHGGEGLKSEEVTLSLTVHGANNVTHMLTGSGRKVVIWQVSPPNDNGERAQASVVAETKVRNGESGGRGWKLLEEGNRG